MNDYKTIIQSYNNSLFSTVFITTFFFLLAIVCLGFFICNLIEPFILSISNFKIDLNDTTDHWLILIVKIQIVQFNSLTQPGLFNFFLLLAFLIVHYTFYIIHYISRVLEFIDKVVKKSCQGWFLKPLPNTVKSREL